MVFNAKNLHYEKQQPAFLQRLRAEHGSDKNNVQFARPNKSRLNLAEDDDGPTIVDGNGREVGKEEFEAMSKGETNGKDDDGEKSGRRKGKDQEGEANMDRAKAQDQSDRTSFGASRKRKIVKAVGNEEESEKSASKKIPDRDSQDIAQESQTSKDDARPETGDTAQTLDLKSYKLPPKKKQQSKKQSKKKIKLSFDEDEG